MNDYEHKPNLGPEQNAAAVAVLSLIAEMELAMMSDPRANHAGIPVKIAVDLVRAGILDSIAQFEDYLRQAGSLVYFVAVPLDFFGTDLAEKTIYPIDVSEMPEYTLWAGVNGEPEKDRLLARLHVTDTENRQRLLRTGIASI